MSVATELHRDGYTAPHGSFATGLGVEVEVEMPEEVARASQDMAPEPVIEALPDWVLWIFHAIGWRPGRRLCARAQHPNRPGNAAVVRAAASLTSLPR